MAPPSYARATQSSQLKASPNRSKVEQQTTLQSTPKKFKRPSTLTFGNRQKIAYNADLYHILKQDPKKPCPLAELPSEIRTVIYEYVLLQPEVAQYPPIKYLARHDLPFVYTWPSLLHVCRAMRIEAAYTYYTSTPFVFTVKHLDFSPVRQWVESLPPKHRALLSMNKQISIHVRIRMRDTHFFPPKGWLFDASMTDQWKTCARFGDIYSLQSRQDRKRFILFCRLANWWLWCAQPLYQNIKWNYMFRDAWRGFRDPDELEPGKHRLEEFLRDSVMSFALTRILKHWTGRTPKKAMVPQARSFLNALEIQFEGLWAQEHTSSQEITKIKNIFGLLKNTIAKWEQAHK